MKAQHTDLGIWGEGIAALYLTKHGYRIIARRWRALRGDIDLVAVKSDEVVFVEVKTRMVKKSHREFHCGAPEDSVTAAKQKQLIRLAQIFMAHHDRTGEGKWRIDVVAVERDDAAKNAHIRHHISAVTNY